MGKPLFKQWFIGRVKIGADISAEGPMEIEWLPQDARQGSGDPFPWRSGDEEWIFYEDYPIETGFGLISCRRVFANGELGEPVQALQTEHHLSFPFLFEDGDSVFMLPEQSASKRLILYECTQFPNEWREHSILMEGVPCLDPVIFRANGRLWLFVSHGNEGTSQNNLYLYHADTLRGPWSPHKLNPLRNGLRGARMGGNVFLKEGRLIRPGQNSVHRYGGSLLFFEIVELSESAYREVEIGEWSPQPSPGFSNCCLHTYNRSSKHAYIDGCRYV